MRAAKRDRCVTVVAHDIGPFGGMESQLATLVAQFLARGIEVRAIGRRIELPPHELLTVVTVSGPARPFPLAYAWFFVAGSIAVARERRGSLYTMGAIVFNRADAAKVPFCHAAWADSPLRRSRAAGGGIARKISAVISARMSRIAERIFYRPARCASLVAMSRSGAEELDHYFPKMAPALTIPNGIDIERFKPNPIARETMRRELAFEDCNIALFLGGDWQRKCLPAVITALSMRPDWALVVAGRGDVDAMRAHALNVGVRDRIAFLGRVSDPERLHVAADALVMPSSYEPFGNAVLEASASGLPVVVAEAHGVRDFVEPGRSGIFVLPRPHEIAAALEILEDPAVRHAYGARGQEIARGYTFESVADRYAELLLGEPCARAAVTPSISQISADTA